MAPAVPVAFAAAPVAVHEGVLPQHVRKPDKTTLLLVIEALIERRSRIGDLLQRRAPLRQILGNAREAVEWRCRRLLVAGLPLDALEAQLHHVAECLLERRPVLSLIGRQFEAGLECGDPRVSKCGDVCGARSMMEFGALARSCCPQGSLAVRKCHRGDDLPANHCNGRFRADGK
jgi:hypothetical protein